eukprot:TRINITY_DN2891_c0_g1_i11.p2 TRINITY_DN2891_c0_g1~~TRINITY_DN2891_c0_g1_i11.p2  ORF type:complete len:266 (-),score=59.32 TRINITY_DN2891_c0_g1_i11:112-909(-)
MGLGWLTLSADVATTSMDLSPTSLQIGRDNFLLNGITNSDERHLFWEKEAFRGLYALASQNEQFDVVLLDPPTFSRIRLIGKVGPPSESEEEERIRRLGKTPTFHFSTKEHYGLLVEYSSSIVSPGGYLITFCNTHSMNKHDLMIQVKEGVAKMHQKKKKQICEQRYVNTRRLLRLRGIKKLSRDKILRNTSFEPSLEEVQALFEFKLVDEWGLPPDFEPEHEMRKSDYLCGLVWQRSYLPKISKKKKTQCCGYDSTVSSRRCSF